MPWMGAEIKDFKWKKEKKGKKKKKSKEGTTESVFQKPMKM